MTNDSFSYIALTIHGQQIKRKGVQKYVDRVKEPGRYERRHSSFYIGLYGENWVNFVEPYKDLVTKLIILNRNERPFSQRGLRARSLILAASSALSSPRQLMVMLSCFSNVVFKSFSKKQHFPMPQRGLPVRARISRNVGYNIKDILQEKLSLGRLLWLSDKFQLTISLRF